jgi:hypothetical protein
VKTYQLDREQRVPRPLPEVFDFFSQAENLDRLTPPWLRFQIVTQTPITVQEGTIIDYRLRYRGLPVRWQTLIEVWEPGVRFVDRALKSPYALWRHTHTFEETPNGTIISDHVEYALPFGPLGQLAHTVMVHRDVNAIFDYRQQVIAQLFPPRAEEDAAEQQPSLARSA